MSKKLHLHLDADTSSKALHSALLARGHDVTRIPTEWMPLDASDEQQLLGATTQGRAIFTYNIRDFIVLRKRYPRHGGIILAFQKSMKLAGNTSNPLPKLILYRQLEQCTHKPTETKR